MHRSSEALQSELADMGATLEISAESGTSYIALKMTATSDQLSKCLELMSDVVLHPAFEAGALEQLKARKSAQLFQLSGEGEFLADDALQRLIYRNARFVLAPSASEIQRITVADIRLHYSNFYKPGNAMLGIAGDIEPAELQRLVTTYFGEWPAGAAARAPEIDERIGSPPGGITIVDRPAPDANISIGALALKRSDTDLPAFWVMNRILGAPMTGRLFLALRQQMGITYTAYSSFVADTFPGYWAAVTMVPAQKAADAVGQVLTQLERLRKEPVDPAEVQENRRAVIARFALSLERPESVLEDWLDVFHFGLTKNYWDRYVEEISNVDSAAVTRVARKYLSPERLQIVCSGDPKQMKDSLARFGPAIIRQPNAPDEDTGN
jgi:zinc protease